MWIIFLISPCPFGISSVRKGQRYDSYVAFLVPIDTTSDFTLDIGPQPKLHNIGSVLLLTYRPAQNFNYLWHNCVSEGLNSPHPSG